MALIKSWLVTDFFNLFKKKKLWNLSTLLNAIYNSQTNLNIPKNIDNKISNIFYWMLELKQ